MKICTNCKSVLEDTDQYCSHCGKKYKNTQKRICPMCKEKILDTHPICNNCYADTINIVPKLIEQIDKTNDKLDNDYPRFESYISKIKKNIDLYHELYYYASFLPDEIILTPPTYEENLEQTIIDIKRFVEGRTRIYRHMLHDLGEMQNLTELKIFRDELIDLAKRYPIFEEAFDTTQIDNIIASYE